MAVYTPEFIAKCRSYVDLRERRDAAAKAAKDLETEYREFEAEFWDELAPDPDAEDQKLHGIKVPLGAPYGTVTFEPRETVYGRIIDTEAALEYFENRALGDEVMAPKFVMARINEAVREAYESGGAVKMPAGTDFYVKRVVAIRRPK